MRFKNSLVMKKSVSKRYSDTELVKFKKIILKKMESAQQDLKLLKETIHTRLNLEMAATSEMVEIALNVKPDMVTIVPEKRQEVTTEGGLDVISQKENLIDIIKKFQCSDIPVSLFIDPISDQIEASKTINANWIELHTGNYASSSWTNQPIELAKIKEACTKAQSIGLRVNAGHGLTYQNVEPIAAIKSIEELNIGHTIISRAIATGLKEAVQEMKSLIKYPRNQPLFRE